MQFFTHLIIPFTALTVAAVPWRGDRNKAVCFGFKETCDKPTGQCCPGLKCDLDNYECVFDLGAQGVCRGAFEPCHRAHGQCCPGHSCDLEEFACFPDEGIYRVPHEWGL